MNARARATHAFVFATALLASRVARAADHATERATEPADADTAEDKEAPNTVEIAVRADHPGVAIERRLKIVEGWQATFGLPVLNNTQEWEPVCVAPCNIKVDPNSHFRISGERVAPSKNFSLPRDRSALTLNVSTGSVLAYDAGVGLTTVGAVLVAVGGFALFYSTTVNSSDTASSLRTASFALGGAGLITGAVGIPLWFFGKSTVFTCPDGTRLATRAGALVF
jgi:hypothetical protein